MKPNVNDLSNEQEYTHLLTVPFENLLLFLFDNMKPNTRTMQFFYFFLLLCVLAVFMFLIQPGYSFAQLFWYGLLGFIASLTVLVPIHELLHGLAFKIFGAGRLKFGKDLKQMMFYVTVDNFVLNRKEFSVLALLPFTVVTLLLLFIEWLLPNTYIWFSLSAIFWHTTMCIGDFAMLAFFEKHKHMELYTYDDAAKKITFFYYKH
ncbi:MAG TPA: DUF3267 domain-containing protein [Bacteroidales bacterium]|nr:DUF3267 domain-containing protein [Bacteroidales bacterium]